MDESKLWDNRTSPSHRYKKLQSEGSLFPYLLSSSEVHANLHSSDTFLQTMMS